MKVLLLSGYDTLSHNKWCQGLLNNFPEIDWAYLKQPGRNFHWRIRSNPLNWSFDNPELLKEKYDLIIATSMVDLATLSGIYPNISNTRKIVYFHENQLTYPTSGSFSDFRPEPAMVNIYAAMCADQVIFNTKYNMDSFVSGIKTFLQKMPDNNYGNLPDTIKTKSLIVPVPIDPIENTNSPRIKNSIIWNHRWEYDKNPEDFYKACKILKEKDIDFKLIIMGKQFRNYPKAFDNIKNEFQDNILCYGEQDYQSYLSWLHRGEYVISTAIHEFQGLAMMEAADCGAIPLVPNRLSYPELFEKKHIYGDTAEDLAKLLINEISSKNLTQTFFEDFYWISLKNKYHSLLFNDQ